MPALICAQEFEEEFEQGKETNQQKNNDDAIKLFYQGQDVHAKGDLKSALDFYSKALKIKPDFPEAEFQRAAIYILFKRYDEAEKSLKHCLQLKPDWDIALTELGNVHVQKRDYEEAEEILTQAVSKNPKNFAAYSYLSEVFVNSKTSQKKLLTLLGNLNKLTTNNKTPVSIWVSKARVERSLGKLGSASSSIESALSLNPKNKQALAESIKIAFAQKRSSEALKRAKVFNSSYPNSDTAKFLFAKSLHINEKSEEALEVLNSIKKPSQPVLELKTTISSNNNTAPASLEKLLKDNPDNVSVLGKLCFLLRVNNPQKALTYCQKALELEKSNINYAIGYGAALVQLKQYQKAAAIFTNLLKYDAENYTVRANLATAFFQLKLYARAKIDYQWIVKQKPDLAVGFYFLAICYDKLQEYKDALVAYEQFLQLADTDKMALEIGKVNLRLSSLKKQVKKR